MRGALVSFAATVLALCALVAPASAQTGVATLTGERLISCTYGEFGSFGCGLSGAGQRAFKVRCAADGSGRITYTVTGLAFGPYPGTFSESGTIDLGPGGTLTRVEVNFHIDSAVGEVDGRKFLDSGTVGGGRCSSPSISGSVYAYTSTVLALNVRYEAIIKPTTGDSFADEGTSSLDVAIGHSRSAVGVTDDVESSVGYVSEGFTSDLLEARPLLPTAKEQCADTGFEIFGVFKNRGDCVAFVQTHGKNEPGQNIAGVP